MARSLEMSGKTLAKSVHRARKGQALVKRWSSANPPSKKPRPGAPAVRVVDASDFSRVSFGA
jgi:hypothetical protein